MVIVIPNIAPAFKLNRFRTFAMFFLTPLIVTGNKKIFGFINRLKKFYFDVNIRINKVEIIFISMILCLYFVFNIGLVNNIMNDKPISLALDIDRLKDTNDLELKANLYEKYIPEQDYYSTIWLSNNIRDDAIIYSDSISEWHVLQSYGSIPLERIRTLYNDTIIFNGEYIYTSYFTNRDGIFRVYGLGYYTLKEINYMLFNENLIYSNGKSDVYIGN